MSTAQRTAWHWGVLVIGCSLLLASACGALRSSPLPPTPATVPVPTPTAFAPTRTMHAQIDQAELAWQTHALRAYRFRVTTQQNLGNPRRVQEDVHVVDNHVVTHQCRSTECTLITGGPTVYTIPELFAIARAPGSPLSSASITTDDCLTLTLDPTYQFPTRIAVDCQMMADEDYTIQVTEFQVAP